MLEKMSSDRIESNRNSVIELIQLIHKNQKFKNEYNIQIKSGIRSVFIFQFINRSSTLPSDLLYLAVFQSLIMIIINLLIIKKIIIQEKNVCLKILIHKNIR